MEYVDGLLNISEDLGYLHPPLLNEVKGIPGFVLAEDELIFLVCHGESLERREV
jgi:hypothetical protein